LYPAVSYYLSIDGGTKWGTVHQPSPISIPAAAAETDDGTHR
jgi:hypothetical protein